MTTRTLTWCALVALLMTAMASQPRSAEARDNVYVGADLGGLFIHFDNYPRRGYGPPPPPPPRYWGHPPPPHWRSWGPPLPPPPRYWHPRPYHHYAPPPRPYHYGRPYRHW